MVDALYPIVGEMVQRAVAEATDSDLISAISFPIFIFGTNGRCATMPGISPHCPIFSPGLRAWWPRLPSSNRPARRRSVEPRN
jgi:hypothetical protein